MTRSIRGLLVLSILVAVAGPVAAQEEPFAGKWTYRSYHNRPLVMVSDDDHAAEKALSLIFGEGIITFEAPVDGRIRGVLDLGGAYALDLAGTTRPTAGSTPGMVEVTGTGRAGTPTAGWEYTYLGFLAPTWANGVRQVPALVGTVIRARPHGSSQPGYVVSFIAVKRP